MTHEERCRHAAMCVACREHDGFSIENLDVVTHEMSADRNSWFRLETPRADWEPYLESARKSLKVEIKES